MSVAELSTDLSTRRTAASGEGDSTVSFEKCVVLAVISDRSVASGAVVRFPELLSVTRPERIPRNTCIVKRISGGQAAISSGVVLAYPFFSSHVCFPVKVGETAWIMFDRHVKSVGYWMSRVHGDETSEDTNFSHYDRTFLPPSQQVQQSGTAARATSTQPPLPVDDFPNLSLAQSLSSNEFDEVVGADPSPPSLEPVPRITKRPEDLVLAGSNNSALIFGTDRAWSADEDPTTSPSLSSFAPSRFAGSLDLVAGLSRWIVSGSTDRTTPATYSNSRSYSETIKDSRRSAPRLSEGDPDFKDDAARVWVVMSTDVEKRFSLLSTTPTLFGEDSVRPTSLPSSAVVAKADEIRLIARKDDDHGINGSIRLIKEGASDDDLVALMLLPDGVAALAGKQIYLGRSTTDGGAGDGSSDAPGSSQPFVKYKQLEDLLTKFLDDVNTFCQTLETHVTPGFGAPSPQVTAAAGVLRSAVAVRKSEIVTLKSTRVFGE